jgi:radical SAM protein with 4Fe4S-binding SPASM domain
VLGNLFNESLKSMSKGKKLAEFMKARPEFCSGCARELECQGGCKAAAEACYGSLCAEEPFLKLNRSQAKKIAT